MIATLIALTLVVQIPVVTCPIMPVEPVASAGEYDYAGLRIGFCCQGCRNAFESDPAEVVKAGRESGRVIAVALFDQVLRKRVPLDSKDAVHVDRGGVRMRFLEPASRRDFLAAPAKFEKVPDQESTFCFARRKEIGSYEKAIGYGDRQGVRYYLDCDECLRRFSEDSESFSRQAADSVKDLQPYLVPPKKA